MNKFFTTLGLLSMSLLFSCKKQETGTPVTPAFQHTTKATTSCGGPMLLFTIAGDKPTTTPFTAMLDIKENVLGHIFIDNENPGYGLGWGCEKYLITDESGKEYEFNSRTAFQATTETGLCGGIRILKNGVEIFNNLPTTLFTILGDQPTTTPATAVLDVKMKADGSILIYNQHPGYGLGWGNDKYTIIDEYGGQYEFTSLTAFDSKTTIWLAGKIRILKNCTVIFSNQVAAENNLFTLTENSRYAILDFKLNTATNDVTVYNQNPGYGLSFGSHKYAITDACGNVFAFTSRDEFHANKPTGLNGGIVSVLKDGAEIFNNQK